MIRRPPRSTQSRSSAASDVYKRQGLDRRHVPAAVAGHVVDARPDPLDRAVEATEDLLRRLTQAPGAIRRLALVETPIQGRRPARARPGPVAGGEERVGPANGERPGGRDRG